MLDDKTVEELARLLDDARRARRELKPLTQTHGDFSLEDAYRIQAAGVALRLARGERHIGFKMGLTSRAKREQMNLRAPVYGEYTAPMQLQDGATFAVSSGIHPKIEPEVAFVLGKPLRGEITRAQALDAVAEVCAAMEILDSRYVGFKYFSLPDVVADNSSSSHFVLSRERKSPRGLPLDKLAMRMSVGGVVKQEARSDEISGHPLDSLVQLCALLQGREVPAGSIVMAGAATLAEPLAPGQEIVLAVESLGEVRVRTAA